MKKRFSINVITGQGGAGHYSTYYAIRAIAEHQQLPWQFQVTDMDDIVTELSHQNRINNAYDRFGISGHDLYNWMLKSGCTWLWTPLMRLNKQLVKLNYKAGVRVFIQRWREQQPDLVVSVMPLFNKGAWESVQQAKPGVPVVTILTDFADCPPHFWLEPGTGNYFVCGTAKAAEQARTLGIPPERVIQTSGLVIHPDFYPAAADGSSAEKTASRRPLMDLLARQQERRSLGLDPNRMTALVAFGGNGSPVMLDIAKRLERLQDQLQVIFICGHNKSLADALRRRQTAQKRYITTFTPEMPYYMQLADFFIGKPGNVSVSEAIAMQLPVITECNFWTMVQERYCAEWVKEKGAGIVLRSFRSIDRAVEMLIQPENYDRYRNNLAKSRSRAVFEVVDLLQQLLQGPVPNSPLATFPATSSSTLEKVSSSNTTLHSS